MVTSTLLEVDKFGDDNKTALAMVTGTTYLWGTHAQETIREYVESNEPRMKRAQTTLTKDPRSLIWVRYFVLHPENIIGA